VLVLLASPAALGKSRARLSSPVPQSTELPHFPDLAGLAADLDSHTATIEITPQTMRDNGIELVIHRLTIGRYPGKGDPNGHDKLYTARFDEVANAGERFGANHVLFTSPLGKDNGAEQAKGFLTAVKDFCPRDEKVLLAVDWEPVKCFINRKWKNCGIPGPAYLFSFARYVTNVTHKKMLIYTFPQVLKTYADDLQKTAADTDFIKSQPLWFAQPYRKFKFATEANYQIGPVLPTHLDLRPWNDGTFWQVNAAEDKIQ
jgi:hypothetical protein